MRSSRAQRVDVLGLTQTPHGKLGRLWAVCEREKVMWERDKKGEREDWYGCAIQILVSLQVWAGADGCGRCGLEMVRVRG